MALIGTICLTSLIPFSPTYLRRHAEDNFKSQPLFELSYTGCYDPYNPILAPLFMHMTNPLATPPF